MPRCNPYFGVDFLLPNFLVYFYCISNIIVCNMLTDKSLVPTLNGIFASFVASPYESIILHQSREARI
ncbi:kup [Gossypium arboreum]|uniref:Kup n=1 Tax=Gossypium arboreum TaxID=29729 RepID=A0A0B0MJW7_GOSAR|nr:kup [Gossypium arboreum]KHG02433.1 kup [Gossypium arboreum]